MLFVYKNCSRTNEQNHQAPLNFVNTVLSATGTSWPRTQTACTSGGNRVLFLQKWLISNIIKSS